MVAVEIMFAIVVAAVLISAIWKMGAPLAEAFAERLKVRFGQLQTEEERLLKARITNLEDELRVIKHQVTVIQDTAEFTAKMLEARDSERAAGAKVAKV
jgi:uncharacterized coiled-coil DUF342 family protein